ncbi:MAG TPA: ABC transporter permease [Nitrososphaera sp.]|jgi:ABC-2 type transport system permease protein|nr:ABC transporter permease [Nitrososphaera sp.]
MQSTTSGVESHLAKLYALWLREFKVFLREKSRLVASTFTPILWLFVIGSGLGAANPSTIPGVDYQLFIFPGIVAMSIIFSSVFFGSYIIWDRKFDFLKSVMVAPVSRASVFIGKTLGGMTTSLIQASILLAVGVAIGVPYTPVSLLQAVAVILLMSFGLTSLGLALGSYMSSLEGFQMIVSFVVFPIFFLSGALFPLDGLPDWLGVLTAADPATYGVDALRHSMLGAGNNPFELDLAVLVGYTAALGVFGILSFRRMRAV